MRYVLIYILFSSILSGCGVQVAKEAGKAIQSINTSLQTSGLLKKEEETITKQKKLVKIELVNKDKNQIESLLGSANLIREDGSVLLMRFDRTECIIYTFLDNQNNKVKYFELRSKDGDLLKSKNDIDSCFKATSLS